jgi:nicotinate dehydrogenase subunit A
MAADIRVNGKVLRLPDVAPDTPLLYALRNDAGLNGLRYGCGAAQCGACTVLLDGRAIQSCVTTVAAVGDAEITTLEGLGTAERPHPLQAAFIAEQAAQCGYCTAGMIVSAASLLNSNPQPSEAQIRAALDRNLCRCGTHDRIIRAVQRAAAALRG